VKPHKGINNLTPMEKLINYFIPKNCKQRADFLQRVVIELLAKLELTNYEIFTG